MTVHVQLPEDIDTDWGSLLVSVFNRMVSAGVIEPILEEPDPWAADMPSWREAAVEYHRDRQGHRLVAEIDPKRLARFRRLLAHEISLERAWHELRSNFQKG